MVTLLGPNQYKPNTAYAEPESAPAEQLDYGEAESARPAEELAAAQPITRAGSTSGTSKKNFWASVVGPLASLRELLAGPPMTEQDRRRQSLEEARSRNAAALNWFNRTPF